MKHTGDSTLIKEKLCFYGSLGTKDEHVKLQMFSLCLLAEQKPFTGKIFPQASKKPQSGLNENHRSIAKVRL